MTDIEMLFKFIGGLGMFLYGMNVMAEGLQKSAGHKMKALLGYLTNNRLMAVLVGAGVTAIIQSSSATTVMIVGFVNAGIMNLTQAVGVIMGANIGTTVTSWLVSMSEWGALLKPEFLAPVFIGIGAAMVLFSKKQKRQDIGQILVGFGVLFIGLSFMSGSITPYKDNPIFSDAFRILGKNPIFGVLAGVIVTGIIQSSSASVGILQTLAMNGVVTWNAAIFITLGQNIGTCVTALLSSAGAHKTAKRAAVIHLLFNVVGAIIFGIVMFVVFLFNKEFANSTISSVQISIFHTVFNVTNTIILFPFANLLVKASGLIIKGAEEEDKEEEASIAARHLDDRILETPAFAIENVVQEVVHMGNLAIEHLQISMESIMESSMEKVEKAYKLEKSMNQLETVLTKSLIKINNLNLTEEQHLTVNNLFYTVSDIERISDHCDNLAELGEALIDSDLKFSGNALEDLTEITEKVRESVEWAIKARDENDISAIQRVNTCEEMVDDLEESLREKHIRRLSNHECVPEKGIIYLDILGNLERMADHAKNIAGYVMDEK